MTQLDANRRKLTQIDANRRKSTQMRSRDVDSRQPVTLYRPNGKLKYKGEIKQVINLNILTLLRVILEILKICKIINRNSEFKSC